MIVDWPGLFDSFRGAQRPASKHSAMTWLRVHDVGYMRLQNALPPSLGSAVSGTASPAATTVLNLAVPMLPCPTQAYVPSRLIILVLHHHGRNSPGSQSLSDVGDAICKAARHGSGANGPGGAGRLRCSLTQRSVFARRGPTTDACTSAGWPRRYLLLDLH